MWIIHGHWASFASYFSKCGGRGDLNTRATGTLRKSRTPLTGHARINLEAFMTIVSRRLVPFAAVIAVALTLAVWITASAGGWPQGSSPLPTMHFTVVPTSQHQSLN